MPRPPEFAPTTRAMRGAVFSPGQGEIAGGVCPLNVGDSWMAPFEGGRMEDLREADHPGLHRYSETRGVPELVDAIVEKARSRNALRCEREGVLVTAGATGALGSALGAIASPGDEVLILSPFWPLIRGIVEAFRARPIEVPFFDRVASASDAVDAVREGLWLLSDEVYEDYVYRGEHVSIGQFAPERTLSVFSFSKAYGMAGNRVGYLIGPPGAVTQALKISTHTFYAAPTSGQLAGLRALRDGDAWQARARALYQEVGDRTAKRLGVPPPAGATYHFLDVSARLDGRGVYGFLDDCVSRGVALAPGPSCGDDYQGWVRLCYTAAPPDEVERAVAVVSELLD